MPDQAATVTLGVEEEFQIIDPATRELRSRAKRVVRLAQKSVGEEEVTNELYLSQVEIGTPVCQTLSEARDQIKRLRRAVLAAAEKDGDAIAAGGTHPFSRWDEQTLTPKQRYSDILEVYQQLTREQVICGCHVHAGIADREVAIQVLNRVRRWLPTVLAIAANSPFWMGKDTGFASYRTELFGRFPLSGIPLTLANRAEFDALVEDLVATGLIDDASKIYWDIRPSIHFETVEFRVTDVAQSIDEAVLVAGLCQGLALACSRSVVADEPFELERPELHSSAKWLAARHGLDGQLFDLASRRSRPAAEVVRLLLDHLRPTLEDLGTWDEIKTLTHQLLGRGNGAQRQRAAYQRTGRFEDVVDEVIAETRRGLD